MSPYLYNNFERFAKWVHVIIIIMIITWYCSCPHLHIYYSCCGSLRTASFVWDGFFNLEKTADLWLLECHHISIYQLYLNHKKYIFYSVEKFIYRVTNFYTEWLWMLYKCFSNIYKQHAQRCFVHMNVVICFGIKTSWNFI